METIIRMLPEFEHRAKAMAKKYKSFVQDYKILTYTVNKVSTDMFIVVLMSIYDKSEMENVSDAYLKNILKEAKRLA